MKCIGQDHDGTEGKANNDLYDRETYIYSGGKSEALVADLAVIMTMASVTPIA